MKTINVNSYFLNCYGLLILILVFMNRFEYDDNLEIVLIYIMGSLLFLPFEICCSKILYFITKKQDFTINWLRSNRTVTVK